MLGITAFSYSRNEPAGSSAELRKRPFALRAHKLLETAAEKDLLVSAAGTLLREGALLWADRKLDWDYTPLGKSLLARAQQAAPDAMALKTVTTELPRPGERPPMIVRVGGKVQLSKLKRQIRPEYPLVARDLGIQGVVSLEVLLGLDGRVLHLRPVSGPSELIPSAVEAVKQWEYQPTLLNGRPCYIATRIDVQFTLSR